LVNTAARTVTSRRRALLLKGSRVSSDRKCRVPVVSL